MTTMATGHIGTAGWHCPSPASIRPSANARHTDELFSIEDLSAAQPEARLECSALYQAMAALPVLFRDALVAVDVLGLSYEEASRALRVREGTITTRLHRARRRVAATLVQDSGIAPTVRHAPPEATATAA
jgi:DNA-directed RNA polymerase specialized sigma24 family protein